MLDGALTTHADGSHDVRFTRVIPKAPEKVWAALTEPSLLRNWLGEVEIEPRVGGHFVLHFRESTDVMRGLISAFEPPRVIEYSWIETNFAPCVVRWELAAHPEGCLLTLTHAAPPEAGKSDVIGYLGGWHAFLDALPGGVDGAFIPADKEGWARLDAGYRDKFAPDEKAVMGAAAQVRFERLLPGPIERVWAHLTDTKLLPAWFGEDSSIEPRQGGAVSLMGGHIRGVVTQWRPPRRLSYTWNVFSPDVGPDAASAFPESYLTLTLEPYGARVLLTLTHMPILARFEKQNAMGWHTMLDILAATLNGESAAPRMEYMRKNAALYGIDLDNLAR